jgi:uncharacterized protein YjeT (DUF2065 family)
MSGVGIVCIVLGILVICGRLPLVVAPGQNLRWLRRLVSSDSRIRVLGAVFVPLGVAMVWVGDPAEGDLAGVVMFLGLWILGASSLLLIAFPATYRSHIEGLTPEEPEGNLIGWRLAGLAGVAIGVIFIYAGVLAL